MAIEERLPPACAFAVSVLQEHEIDPDAVPEEAVEAAQEHLVTCNRCLSSPPIIGGTPRKKKRTRKTSGTKSAEVAVQAETPKPEQPRVMVTLEEAPPFMRQKAEQKTAAPIPSIPAPPEATPNSSTQAPTSSSNLPAVLKSLDGLIDCAQCRELLPEYAEAMDSGKDVETLYPEVYDHLLMCDAGCLILLDLLQQEAKSNRKYRRRPVHDPFSAIGWELSGFFRTGQISMSPMALAYGTLILLLLVASLSVFLTTRWDDARYARPTATQHVIPTPDGIGLSDGLHVYDACNTSSYQDKRAAAQALQQQKTSQANTLLAHATTAVHNDTSGCNGAEAAIYQEDLQVRQSGRPFGLLIVSFDSGPGKADVTGGTDRHMLYAAYTQELIGAYIAQSQYNSTQMNTAGAPLLYLVLANTTGEEQGALQIANTVASLAHATDLSSFGLLVKGQAPLLGLLGLAPSSLLQVALPVLCHAGIPVISPTATGLFLVKQLQNTSMYQHCAPGFAFVRFSTDDAGQSAAAANYAYTRLKVRNAAIFSDPSNPSSEDYAADFLTNFRGRSHTRIVAQETAVSSGLLDNNGNPQADSDVLLAGLNDALQAKPQLIFAPMLTNDVIALARAIAQLPAEQQPVLMIGGEFVHPAALQNLVQWARQQKLTLPRIYISLTSAVRPPINDWQKQFYASFCQSFTAPSASCSGIGALDQGGLLFADGVELVGLALTNATQNNTLPTSDQLLQKMSQANFAGISGQVSVHFTGKALITSKGTSPVVLGLQDDGSLQIVG